MKQFTNAIYTTLLILAGVGAFLTAAMITVDVLLRTFGGYLPGTFEIVVNYFMLMIGFLPLMVVERDLKMISVESVYLMSSPAVRWLMLVVSGILTAAVYMALAYTTYLDAMHKFTVKAYATTMGMSIATWPGYFILPISFAIAFIYVAIRTGAIIFNGQAAAEIRNAIEGNNKI